MFANYISNDARAQTTFANANVRVLRHVYERFLDVFESSVWASTESRLTAAAAGARPATLITLLHVQESSFLYAVRIF